MIRPDRKLSWGLMVCTYNRAEFLTKCLKHALKQTYLPAEIVIVDASEYWEETFKQVSSTYADDWKEVRLVYEPARIRSLALQRNQALDLCRSDVIFSLDDDIYLQPQAAGIIMEAYEKDVQEEIAVIGGHFVDSNPDQEGAEKGEPDLEIHGGIVGYIRTRLEQRLSMDHHFVPYDRDFNLEAPPASVRGLDLYPSALMNGGRTTFRRRFGVQSRWSELLRYGSIHEDGDFSYRISKFGRILAAPKAGFFHADAAGDRPDRFKNSSTRVRNLMALHRVSSDNKFRSSWRLLVSFISFVGLYLLIDPARKRYSLPIVRAYALGILQIPVFMFYPFRDFSSWYLGQQEKKISDGSAD